MEHLDPKLITSLSMVGLPIAYSGLLIIGWFMNFWWCYVDDRDPDGKNLFTAIILKVYGVEYYSADRWDSPTSMRYINEMHWAHALTLIVIPWIVWFCYSYPSAAISIILFALVTRLLRSSRRLQKKLMEHINNRELHSSKD